MTLEDLSEKSDPVSIVTGERHYFATLFEMTGPPVDGGYCKPWWFEVVRDPANEHDKNAIAVYAMNGDRDDDEIFGRVGFVVRDLARIMAPGLDDLAARNGGEAVSICVPGLLVGGYSKDRPHIGVYLYLNDPAFTESIGLPDGLLDGYGMPVESLSH